MKTKFTSCRWMVWLSLLLGLATSSHAQERFYGTSQVSNQRNSGTIFSLLPDGSDFKTEYELPEFGFNGNRPSGQPVLLNGKLYGVTMEGGTGKSSGTTNNNRGVIYSYDPAIADPEGAYTVLFSFEGIGNGANETGGNPQDTRLVVHNNKLYGIARTGGPTATSTLPKGTLFVYDPAITGPSAFTILHGFEGGPNDGAAPIGELVVHDNIIYGFTSLGGQPTGNGFGTLYSYNLTTGVYTHNLYVFPAAINPRGMIVYNNLLYGMTRTGGANNNGTIFSFNPSSGVFSNLYDFDAGTGTTTFSGRQPYGIFTVYNNKLYAMASLGGANNLGTIFNYDPALSGPSAFTKLYDFSLANGAEPRGSFLVHNNIFYGYTWRGGGLPMPTSAGFGTIFSYDPALTGDAAYTKLYSLAGTSGGVNPSVGEPLLLDGELWGATNATAPASILFSFRLSDQTFSKKFNFNVPGYWGRNPVGSGIVYNGKLYGTTAIGGTNNAGVLYSFNFENGEYKKLLDFPLSGTGTTNNLPSDYLVIHDNKIYGVTENGGTLNFGTVYSYDLSTDTHTVIIDFDITNGRQPKGDLVYHNGKIYGQTRQGGTAANLGVLFAIDVATGAYSIVDEFATGEQLSTQRNNNLIVVGNKLWGVNSTGGANTPTGRGYIYSIDLDTYIRTREYDFIDGVTGGAPRGRMLYMNGKLMGVCGQQGEGIGPSHVVIYSFDPATKEYTYTIIPRADEDPNNNIGNYSASSGPQLIPYNGNFYSLDHIAPIKFFKYDPLINAGTILYTGPWGQAEGTFAGITLYTPRQPQTISNFDATTKTYGDADFDPGATSDNATIPITYTSDNPDVVTITDGKIHIVGAGTANITASQAENNSFMPADTTVVLTVNKAPLSITANDVVILYGDPIPSVFTAAYQSFVNDDDSSVLEGPLSFTTAATDASPAGEYDIIVSGPAENPNYELSYHNGKLTISDGTAIVAFGSSFPAQIAYGAAPFHPGATSSAGTAPVYTTSDPEVATVTPDNKIKINGAGTVTITASFAAGNSFGEGSASKTLTVSPAALTITARDYERKYKDADPVFDAVYTGFVNGDDENTFTTAPQFSTLATSNSLPGVYDITVCCAVSPDYTMTYVKGKLTVVGNQDVVFNPFSVMTYGDAPFDPVATSSADLIPVYTTDNPGVAVIENGKVRITGAGTATITVTFPASGDYLSTVVSQPLTVQPKQLTISADNIYRLQGQPNPILTVSYSGFVNGDTYLNLAVQPNVVTTAVTNSPVGAYPITVSGAQAFNNNYTIGYANGTLTVAQPRTLSFGVISSKTYGDPDFTVNAVASTGETVQYSSSDPSVATINSGGSIHITGAGVTLITATLPANQYYPVPTLVSNEFTVSPAGLLATANNQTKAYRQVNPVFSLHYAGFVNGDDESILLTLPVAATSAQVDSYPGEYPITLSGGNAGKNYILQYVSGTLTITPEAGTEANSMNVLLRSRSQLDVNFYLVDQEPVSIMLYDLGGRILKNERQPFYKGFNTYSMDVSNLPTGAYIVKTVGKGLNLNQKILIH